MESNDQHHEVDETLFLKIKEGKDVTMDDIKTLAHDNYHDPVLKELDALDFYLAFKNVDSNVIHHLTNRMRPISLDGVDLRVETTLYVPTRKYVSSNSSILLDEVNAKLIVNVRLVDYIILPDSQYHGWKKDNIFNTSNVFKTFDLEHEHHDEGQIKDLKVTKDTFLDFETNDWGEQIEIGKTCKGMEDVRISWDEDGKIIILATVQHNDKLNIGSLDMNTKTLKVYYSNECEKNWAPINKTSLVVKKWYPYTLLNLKTKEEKIFPEFDFNFRGSSQFVDIPNDVAFMYRHDNKSIKLGLIHQVFFKDDIRYYLHRFVLLNSDNMPRGASRLFYFMNQPIEYNCGLTIINSYDGYRIYIPISARDCNSTLISLNIEAVMNMIIPIREFTRRVI